MAAESSSNPPERTTRTVRGDSASTDSVQQIGPYRILEVIGEGGMGTVYLADQQDPVRRRVALKVIKLGMDTKEVLSRFEAERQAIALMNHPNIAKVHEAGTTAAGQPYFSMEHVPGLPITKYCDQQRLRTKDRLKLFIAVCDGVHHAHQKGIIHRDIKPSNVLVHDQGERPIPKIIDFGLAKATNQRLTERTVFTQRGQMIGTPEYMSPEQAEMTSEDIDTRSDVYSLGVLLYELLVGTRPFERSTLLEEGPASMHRVIREREPAKPSSRLSELGDAVTEAARSRRAEPRSLMRELRGDLDWITMKALEKNRVRRYGSAAAFAEDIVRHLNHEAVVAGPPSTIYRLKKFVRRRRGLVAAASIVFFTLLGGIIGTATQAEKARLQTEIANRKAKEAKHQADIAQAVNTFLNHDLLGAVSPDQHGFDVTVREVLDEASLSIRENRFEGLPLVEARIRLTLGNAYADIGQLDNGISHLEEALALYRRELGEDHADTLTAMNSVAMVYKAQARYRQAETLYKQALQGRTDLFGEDHRETLLVVNNLGALYQAEGRHEDAEQFYLRAAAGLERVLGKEDPDTLNTLSNLAIVYKTQGRYDEAAPLYERVLEIRVRVLGPDHHHTLRSYHNKGSLLQDQGKLKEAVPVMLKALEGRRKVLGASHPETLLTVNNLGTLYHHQGRFAEAEPLYKAALEGRKQLHGNNHPETISARGNLATVYHSTGRYAEAEELFKQSLDGLIELFGEDSERTVITMSNLANLYRIQGKNEQAIPLFQKAIQTLEKIHGPDHPNTLTAMNGLATVYATIDRYAEAIALHEKVVDARRRVLGEQHPQTMNSQSNLAAIYVNQGRFEEAEPLLKQALEVRSRVLGEKHPHTLRSLNNLARLYNESGRFEEAEPFARQAVEKAREALPQGHAYTAVFLTKLGVSLTGLERFQEAEVSLKEAHGSLQSGPTRYRDQAVENLVDLYDAWGKPDKAREWKEQLPQNNEGKE